MRVQGDSSLAVFVNSSDGFQDCWDPFFALYQRYGTALAALPLYLNTERAAFAPAAVALTSTRVWPAEEAARPTWSECLLRGLRAVREPYVLYLQEDYFLTQPVNASMIAQATATLTEDPTVGVVYLNRYGPQFKRIRPYKAGLVEVGFPARYPVSTQAAVWRKEFLMCLARPWENGWMFEKFAGLRVWRRSERLISVSPEIMRTAPVIDYVYTGVIKGQWKAECEPLFRQHGITVDFSRRGFYRDRGRLKSRYEVLGKLLKEPAATWRSLLSVLAS